jgi:hypothetical protein
VCFVVQLSPVECWSCTFKMLQSLMKATLLLVMALLLLGSVGARQLAAPFYPPGTPVKDLDATTYDVVVNSKKKYIVVYYASWCGKFFSI